jgi:predicted glycosyl hydrolase (DUF1957 family)
MTSEEMVSLAESLITEASAMREKGNEAMRDALLEEAQYWYDMAEK